MYRHAIAAALFLLPCSCAQGSLRMTKLFHACSLQLGIVSLFHRYRRTSPIKVDGAAADRHARRAMPCMPTLGNIRSRHGPAMIDAMASPSLDLFKLSWSNLERPQEIQKILLLVRLKPIEKSPHHHIGLGPAAPVFLDCPLQIRGSAVMKEEDTLP